MEIIYIALGFIIGRYINLLEKRVRHLEEKIKIKVEKILKKKSEKENIPESFILKRPDYTDISRRNSPIREAEEEMEKLIEETI